MGSSSGWHALYLAALVETDRSKLQARLDAAQAAIDQRLEEVNADGGLTPEERQRIETAQAGLDVLRKNEALDKNQPFTKGMPS